jgi:hypothetical protein
MEVSATVAAMGFFDVHCAHSGLALVEDTRLVLLLETDGGWTPLGAPLHGTYDRLGGIDEPQEPTPAFRAFSQWMEELVGEGDFEEALFQLREGEGQWKGRELNYALVDEGVFQALGGPLEPADPGLPEGLRGLEGAASRYRAGRPRGNRAVRRPSRGVRLSGPCR